MAKLVNDDMMTGGRTASLGWVGADPDAPSVVELRSELSEQNGLLGLEIVAPHELDRAAQLFYRDGFVMVHDVLTADQTAALRAVCEREMQQVVARDPQRLGNRGSHRYSFGAASLTGALTHLPEWSTLIDLPLLTPLIAEIFESDQYSLIGTGGDFCLPGAIDYQRLHTDLGTGGFHDPVGRLTMRDLPCPWISCNFATVPFTALNGPTRQIPGTQYSRLAIPDLTHEPEWMKRSTVCPAPAGSVIIRDVRAWHGGTPNVSDQARAIPNVEFAAPWFRSRARRHLPRDRFDTLSELGKRIARDIVIDSHTEVELGYRSDIGNPALAA